MTLDVDVIAPPKFCENIRSVFSKGKYCICHAKLLDVHPDEKDIMEFNMEKYPYRFNTDGKGIVVVDRSKAMEIRGWDERFKGWGGEDNDFENRISVVADFCSIEDASNFFHIPHPINRSKKEQEETYKNAARLDESRNLPLIRNRGEFGEI